VPRVGFLLVAAIVLATTAACRRVDENAPGRVANVTPTSEDAEGSGPIVHSVQGGNTTVVVPDFARVTERVGPSVVTVISTVPRDGERGSKVVRGLGSGMIVSVDGQILTNEHVVAAASRVEVELSTHELIPATVKIAEPLLDLALLQLDEDVGGLEPVEFIDRHPRPGEWVMAVGQPFGLGNTVTVGVVSGLGRDHDDLGRPEALRKEGVWSFIQTDASINIGNSGGPLVSPDGHVVGITTAVRSDGQGLAFAIPAPMATRFLEEVRTFGRVRLARLGIRADNAAGSEAVGMGSAVRVTSVDADGPGARAGLQEGDFILQIGGDRVNRVSDVAYLTQLHGVGARITFSIKRGEERPQDVEIVPDERR
jgi:S1-C subfamily serine protease